MMTSEIPKIFGDCRKIKHEIFSILRYYSSICAAHSCLRCNKLFETALYSLSIKTFAYHLSVSVGRTSHRQTVLTSVFQFMAVMFIAYCISTRAHSTWDPGKYQCSKVNVNANVCSGLWISAVRVVETCMVYHMLKFSVVCVQFGVTA